MPFRNLHTLESWLSEFFDDTRVDWTAKVIVQDGDDGADTGLVGIHLANASTTAYIQPDATDATRWVTTMEARDTAITLTVVELSSLAAELASLADLCEFLQKKSSAFVGDDRA